MIVVDSLTIQKGWSLDNQNYIREKLREYNASHISADLRSVYEDVSFLLKDEKGQIFGGITGAIKWNYFHINFLWIDDRVRGMGFGKKLISEIEAFAKEKDCDFIEVDTFSFQAPDFYIKNGFEVICQVENAPRGHTHYYLIKKLK